MGSAAATMRPGTSRIASGRPPANPGIGGARRDLSMPEWLQVLQGLYKVEMHTVHGSRRGVLYVYDGKMMGGNSAYAFIGTFQESGSGEVSVDISTLRHNDDQKFQPLFKADKITLSLKGRQQGDQHFFEGGT